MFKISYTILNKLWFCWREYTHEHKHETNLEKKAIEHYNLKLKQFYLNELKLNRLDQLRKKSKLTLAQLKLNKQIIQDTFEYWCLKLKQNQKIDSLEVDAEKHFKLVQLTKVFSVWYYKFISEKEERRVERLADKHYKLTLYRKCLKSLIYYSKYRKRKQIQKEKLREYADSQLVYRVYQMWYEKLQQKQLVNDLEEQIGEFKIKHQLIRVFNYWKTSYKQRLQTKDKLKQMIKFYEKKLKLKAFNAIKDNYLKGLNERKDLMRAEKFYEFSQKRIVYNVWLDKLEDKNEIKIMHLIYKAKKHYETKLTNKALLYWKAYRVDQLELKVIINF